MSSLGIATWEGWRSAILAGAALGVVLAIVAFVATTAAFTMIAIATGVGDAGGTQSLASVFTDPSITAHDVRRALYVTVVTAGVNMGRWAAS